MQIVYAKYQNRDPYPNKPDRPMMPAKINSDSMLKYSSDLRQWEMLNEKYRAELDARRDKNDRLAAEYKEAVLTLAGFEDHPRRDKIWSFAVDHTDIENVGTFLEELNDIFGE